MRLPPLVISRFDSRQQRLIQLRILDTIILKFISIQRLCKKYCSIPHTDVADDLVAKPMRFLENFRAFHDDIADLLIQMILIFCCKRYHTEFFIQRLVHYRIKKCGLIFSWQYLTNVYSIYGHSWCFSFSCLEETFHLFTYAALEWQSLISAHLVSCL